MEVMKKLFAVMLSASLVFTNTIPSFAEEAEAPEEENTVEQQVVEEDTALEPPENVPETDNIEENADDAAAEEAVNLNQTPIIGSAVQNGVSVNVTAPENSFPEGTNVVITSLSAEQAAQQIQSEVPQANALGFDISFVKGAEKVQPQNGQTVSLQFIVDGESEFTKHDTGFIDLYHVSDTGEIELLKDSNAYKKGDATVIDVQASSFSPFILVENEVITTEESTEEKPSEAVHDDIITDFDLYTQDGTTPIGESTIGRWSIERLTIQFALPNGEVHEGDTTTITLPNELAFDQTAGFQITDSKGNVVANAVINGSAKTITLTFTDYVETHSDITGSFFCYVETDRKYVVERKTVVIELNVDGKGIPKGPYTFDGIGKAHEYRGQKWGWQKSSTDPYRLVWRIRLNTDHKGFTALTIDDKVQAAKNTCDPSTFRIYKGTWIDVNGDWTLSNVKDVTNQYTVTWAPDYESFTLPMGDIAPEDGFEIRYETVAGYELQDSEVISNRATLTSSDDVTRELDKKIRYAEAGGQAEGYVFEIGIKKVDEYTGDSLEGAVFNVIRAINGDVVGTITTDASGNGSIKNLLKETYILKETQAPKGYVLSDKEYTITPEMFGDTHIAVIDIDNTPYSSVTAKLNAKKAGNKALGDNTFEFELLDETRSVIQTTDPVTQGEIANFTELTYIWEDLDGEDAKTFTYYIREKLPEGVTEQNPVKDGITYDTHEEEVKITVTDDKTGVLKIKYDGNETFTTPEFENTVSRGGLRIQKEVEGTTDKDKDFLFEITLTAPASITLDDTYPASLNGEETTAQVVDGKVSVTLKADQYYEIKELSEGTEYTVKEVTLPSGYTLKESTNAEGKITPEGAVSTFINTYKAEGEGEIKVQKTLEGREWKTEDSFEFTITPVEDAPATEKDKVTVTKASADYTESFGKIKFTKAGTYTYTVTETKGSIEGVTYDTTEHTVVIKVVDDGQGNLVAEEGDSLIKTEAFTNTFSATEATIEATKEFNDWGKADSFTFNLEAVTPDAPMPASTTATATEAEKTASFGEITFEKSGTYTYTITEVNDGVDGVTYDTTAHQVVVEVTADPETNELSAKVTYDGAESLTITNTYEGTETTLEAIKQFNDWGAADSFTFNVAPVGDAPAPENTRAQATEDAPTANFGTVKFEKAGTYEYIITEVDDGVDGVTYDTSEHKAVVTVTKEAGTNKLSASVKYDDKDALVITNTYATSSEKATIQVTKAFEDWSKADSFTFNLAAVGDAPMPANTSVTVTKEAPTGVFGQIEYKKFGTYEYTITEVNDHVDGVTYDTAEHKVVVEVTKGEGNKLIAAVTYDGAESLVIINTYASTKAPIEVTKEFNDWAKAESFTFNLEAVDGAPMPATTTAKATEAEKTASFGEITFEKSGTYKYTITEVNDHVAGVTYDTKAHEVVVEVTADPDTNELSAKVTYDGSDSLVVTNTFTATTAHVEATKEINYWGKNGEFTFSFELAALTEGAPMPETTSQTVKKDSPTAVFGDMTFEKAGTYQYTITEKDEGLKGVTYDTAPHTATVEVTADPETNALSVKVTYADGEKAVITNKYEAKGEYKFGGIKTLEGRELKDAEFSFTLTGDKSTDQTVTNTGESFTFAPVEFTLEDLEQNEDGTYKDGTFKFTIKEVAGDAKGVNYDDTTYDITLTVSDKGDGTLEVTADKEIEAIKFVNVYQAQPGNGEFVAKKVLSGNQKLKDQQFTFELKDKDGKVLQSKKNDANGNVQFDKIEYKEAGEYVYTVSEVNDGQKDIIYDNSVYTITVKAEDDGQGNLKVTSVITKGGQVVNAIAFRNTTTPNTGIHNGSAFLTGTAAASLSGIAILEYLRRRQKNSKK